MDPREEIEQILGHGLAEAERGTVATLNDFTEPLLAEARRLPWPLVHIFVRHYLNPESRSFIPQFVDDVVSGSVPVTEWRRGRILAPDFTVRELISLDVQSVLDVLGPREDENWQRIRPDRARWEAKEEWIGSPVLPRPELDYRYIAGPHALDFVQGYGFELEDVNDIAVATRRWIASRFAASAWQHGLFGVVRSLTELMTMLSFEPEEPSADALVSFRALLAEDELGPLKENAVPGFRGPDAWYLAA